MQNISKESLKTYYEVSEDWDEYSVSYVNQLLQQASQVIFKPLASYRGRIFGQIEIKTFDNRNLNLAKELITSKHALEKRSAVPKGIHFTLIFLMPK